MILLTAQSKILLSPSPQDFRKGIDGFAALCRNQLNQDPRSGLFFVFINRSKTMIRLLAYDGAGFWLMTKRLSKGQYRHWPQGEHAATFYQAKQLRGGVQNSETTEFFTHKSNKSSKKACQIKKYITAYFRFKGRGIGCVNDPITRGH